MGSSSSGRQDESDTENISDDVTGLPQQQLVPSHKLAAVEKKCEDLTNKMKVSPSLYRTK
jgi:hypothetical protein